MAHQELGNCVELRCGLPDRYLRERAQPHRRARALPAIKVDNGSEIHFQGLGQWPMSGVELDFSRSASSVTMPRWKANERLRQECLNPVGSCL